MQGEVVGQPGLREAPQEAAQRLGVGVGGQPGEILENAVAAQELRCLDPLEPQEDRIHRGQGPLGRALPVVPLREAYRLRQAGTKTQLLDELMEQDQAIEVRQARSGERDRQIAGAAGHYTEIILKVRFGCKRLGAGSTRDACCSRVV